MGHLSAWAIYTVGTLRAHTDPGTRPTGQRVYTAGRAATDRGTGDGSEHPCLLSSGRLNYIWMRVEGLET